MDAEDLVPYAELIAGKLLNLDWIRTIHIFYLAPLSPERDDIARAKLILRLKDPDVFGQPQLDQVMEILLGNCPFLVKELVDIVDISGRRLNKLSDDDKPFQTVAVARVDPG